MADDYASYVANLRHSYKQKEQEEQIQELRDSWNYHKNEMDKAISEGDESVAGWNAVQMGECENEYEKLVPPAPDQRAVNWLAKNKAYLERFGQNANNALAAAHQYVTRPRTDSQNPGFTGMGFKREHWYTPAYFDRVESLLEMYGQQYQAPYHRENSALTPNEAATAAGLSPNEYNASVKALQAQGRLRRK